MRKRAVISVMLTIALIVLMLPPGVSIAANEDFEVTFEFIPEEVGDPGGEPRLQFVVTNNGTTDITWVRVDINTSAGFYMVWDHVIRPGDSSGTVSLVPFAPEDLNVEKTILFSMNNNSTANPDGIQINKFTLTNIHKEDMVRVSGRISPSKSEYYFGEEVQVTYEFENITSAQLVNVETRILVFGNMEGPGEHMVDTGYIAQPNLSRGDSTTHRVSFELTDEADGGIAAYYFIIFEYCEVSFTLSDALIRKNVVERIPVIEFDASLNADPTAVLAGEDVNFEVTIHNTGGDAIESFDIVDSEGVTVAGLEGLEPGDAGTSSFTKAFDETTLVYYKVIGRTGEHSAQVDTNSVIITIEAPAEPTETVTQIVQEEEPETTAEPVETAQTETSEGGGVKTYLYIIIGVLGALILAAAAVLAVILTRRKRKRKSEL
ncbi:MAG: hypothetical protein HN948_08730 [Clostridia bacterium]|jgi:hypothetical protein|nr:hypothetical protein [Clostridia bacterium]MBT7123074.1 hypothetical protein [Clostridia bacterium]